MTFRLTHLPERGEHEGDTARRRAKKVWLSAAKVRLYGGDWLMNCRD